jgi:4'-phosphopantetheinyl transferase
MAQDSAVLHTTLLDPPHESVTLRLFDLSEDEPLPSQWELLTADERDRARRLVVARKRNQFVRARAELRISLSDRLGAAPAVLNISYGERGKPFLADHPDLHFNLSHSAGKAALVICEGRRVGVDIEDATRERRYDAFSKRFFAREERDWLMASQSSEMKDRFYRIWTNKEAYVKALGTGFGLAPGRYALSLADPCAAELLRSDQDDAEWNFVTSIPAPGFVMSVCSERIGHPVP